MGFDSDAVIHFVNTSNTESNWLRFPLMGNRDGDKSDEDSDNEEGANIENSH